MDRAFRTSLLLNGQGMRRSAHQKAVPMNAQNRTPGGNKRTNDDNGRGSGGGLFVFLLFVAVVVAVILVAS